MADNTQGQWSESADSAMVRVQAWLPAVVSDYDSGWFEMSSQAGSDSYKEVQHGLGCFPGHVKVMVKATDGSNAGFVFEGVGAAQTDDDQDQYGGVVFAYNDSSVRIWAPSRHNGNSNGRMIFVGDGWADNTQGQWSESTDSAMARVQA